MCCAGDKSGSISDNQKREFEVFEWFSSWLSGHFLRDKLIEHDACRQTAGGSMSNNDDIITYDAVLATFFDILGFKAHVKNNENGNCPLKSAAWVSLLTLRTCYFRLTAQLYRTLVTIHFRSGLKSRRRDASRHRRRPRRMLASSRPAASLDGITLRAVESHDKHLC